MWALVEPVLLRALAEGSGTREGAYNLFDIKKKKLFYIICTLSLDGL